MNIQQFRGTGVAVITPFKSNGAIDFSALERIIEHLIQPNGVDYIISLGTTGEAIPLTASECREVLDFTIEKVNKRVPIVAGFFGGNNTKTLCEKLRTYNFEGITAVMSSSPSYNKPTQEGIYRHYMEVGDSSPLPIIIYNVPSRTSSNLEAETILRIARGNEKFIAVKEAAGSIPQATKLIKDKPDNFLVVSGDDPITLGMIGCGGDGVISVIANAFPVEFSTMVRSALNGDYAKAQHYNNLLFDLHKWLYCDGNPGGIKATMSILGFCENVLRLPLVEVSDATYQKIKEEVSKIRASL